MILRGWNQIKTKVGQDQDRNSMKSNPDQYQGRTRMSEAQD